MADVMDSSDTLDRRRDRREKPTSSDELPPPPPLPATLARRRDRDSRERDDRPARRGEYNDRRSPPPPPPRDRDYKRRVSPSPPPYRERRGSPSRRGSPPPPPAKRSRREDGGYDNRRGSPRNDDRRFGQDYGGGYDRHHGRYGGRGSDWSDSGRGGYVDGSSNTNSTPREGLMSYKLFIQELEDDVLPSEAERRYQEYKTEYITTQKRTFFESHKEEEWLKDKYHPTNLVSVIERRNEHARSTAKEFLLDLRNGNLDLGPSFVPPLLKPGQGIDLNSEDEADAGGKRKRNGRGSGNENDLIAGAPKAHSVSSELRRIQVDVEQAQALVRKLDREKGIEDNILAADTDRSDGDKAHTGSMGPIVIIRGLNTVRGLEGVELLDVLLTFLWRVHGLNYYGMIETSEPKGSRHVRADKKSNDESLAGAADWENKFDSCWRERLHGQDPLEKRAAKEKLEAAAVEALDPLVRKIRDEKYGWKYGCGAKGCTKLFHAAEFVYKHLRLKHPELVMELTSKVREDIYFENYMNDPDAPGGTPVMQQSVPRRRFGLEGRLGNNRRDLRDRLKGDPKSPPGGSEGGNTNDPMFDSFNHGGPAFSADMPPPPQILMPVPGAGPLGPFVAAPPEVAMRMMRDQGGPTPYDGNGAQRGRNGGRAVPPAAPILPVAPLYRQDPRRIRSYQDLDAPEDEVSVIDYRSI